MVPKISHPSLTFKGKNIKVQKKQQLCVSDWLKTDHQPINIYIYIYIVQLGYFLTDDQKKGKEKTESKILGMLTIANIISHYRESASPCEFPIAL